MRTFGGGEFMTMTYHIKWLLPVLLCFGMTQDIMANGGRPHSLYVYWGWNRAWYSSSDITFQGPDYHFTLHKADAHDKPTPFSLDPYFHPKWITIPQTNLRIGYDLGNSWDISIGVDHMKYVVTTYQKLDITGYVSVKGSPYAGVYDHQRITLTDDFVHLEHTDGLNYMNLELRKTLFKLHSSGILKNIELSGIAGGGTGVLLPKTNATLLGHARHDDFHLSGFGFAGISGLRLTFYQFFFLQSEA